MLNFLRNLYSLCQVLSSVSVKSTDTGSLVTFKSGLTLKLDTDGGVHFKTPADLRANAEYFYFNCEDDFIYSEQTDYAQTSTPYRKAKCREGRVPAVSV
jgi:hypothetical protein